MSDAVAADLVLSLQASHAREGARSLGPLIDLSAVTKTYDSGELAVRALSGIDLGI